MKFSLLSALSLTAVFLSSGANALASKEGVIKSVDLEKSTVVLNNKKYVINESTRIIVDGKPATIADLSEAQSVTYKVKAKKVAAKPASKELKAEIVGVDAEAGKIEVKPASQDESISFAVGDATKISGDGSSIQDLAVGQSVTLRFRAK